MESRRNSRRATVSVVAGKVQVLPVSNNKRLAAQLLSGRKRGLRTISLRFCILAWALMLVCGDSSNQVCRRNWKSHVQQEWQITTRVVCEQGLIWLEDTE